MKTIIQLVNKVIGLLETLKGILPELLARLVIGIVFITSGWWKLHNLEQVTQFFVSLGIPNANIVTPFTASNELLFGLLIFFGLGTRVACVALTCIMTVAIVTAKSADIHELGDLFKTSEFLYILPLMFMLIQGPGKVSIDHMIAKKFRSKV